MKSKALYLSLFWLLFAAITCEEAYRLKLGTINKPGSGFFPFTVGAALLLLSLIALVQSTKGGRTAQAATDREPMRWWNIVIILAAITAYALSLNTLGFLVNTFLFVALVLKLVARKPWKTVLIAGVITAVAADLVFNLIFNAQIPSGIFGY